MIRSDVRKSKQIPSDIPQTRSYCGSYSHIAEEALDVVSEKESLKPVWLGWLTDGMCVWLGSFSLYLEQSHFSPAILA